MKSRPSASISIILFSLIFLSIPGGILQAQLVTSGRWTKEFSQRYTADLDIPYKANDTGTCRLDCYSPKESKEPVPVLVWIHGGGWRKGTKDSTNGLIPRFLEKGWGAVNVDYRLTAEALAPAAVIDCRCAFAWVVSHASEYHFDPEKIVIAGTSAGGHLSLITGMLPDGCAFDSMCGPIGKHNIAAILNFYGITDVADLLGEADRKGYAVKWFGDLPDRMEIARSVSPLTYVREPLPPVFTAHGDADTTVPYTHAVRLKHALDSLKVMNELYTVQGGYHGKWGKETDAKIFKAIVDFLRKAGVE